MLDEWPSHARLDAARVGAFGFSNGGFTVLVAAGGTPYLSKIAPCCEARLNHDLCDALRHASVDPRFGTEIPASAWIHDPRIKAVVVAAFRHTPSTRTARYRAPLNRCCAAS